MSAVPNKLSAVILFWNKPSLTLRCARATHAAQAARGAHAEGGLFLVDNGSSQANREAVKKALRESKIQTEFVMLPANLGFSKGMNAGLRRAFSQGADLVAAVSNDVEVAPDFFKLLSGVHANRAAIYCATVHHLLDRTKVAYTHGSVNPETLELAHHTESAGERIRFPDYYPAAVTVWTRTAFEQLHGFNEDFFCYWEDVELSYRARSAGIELIPLANARVFHLSRGTTGGKSAMTASFFEGRERFRKILNEGTL